MITITPRTFDPVGSLVIHELPSSRLGERTRRFNRSKTLDPVGVHVQDFGLYDGDRTLQIQWRPNEAEYRAANRMMELYSKVTVAIRDGIYYAMITRIDRSGDEASMEIIVEQKIG